jgi:hypothetical protein
MIKKYFHIYILIISLFSGCIKDRDFGAKVYQDAGVFNLGTRSTIHYWNFNGSNLLTPTITRGGGSMQYVNGGAFDAYSNGSILNVRNNDVSGTALRLRNPAGSFIINASTSNYKDVVVTFASQRSSNGAQQNIISYSVDGSNFITDSLIPNIHQPDTIWQQYSYDFSEIKRANNNPNFKIKFTYAISDTGTSGNNRYDNFSIDGNIINILPPPPATVLHYWNFNGANLLNTTTSVGNGALNYTAVYDSYTPGSAINVRNGDVAGNAIRLRNISATDFGYGNLLITAPTTGYKNIKLSLEVQASGNGPQSNAVSYTIDGTNFINTGLANTTYTPGAGAVYNLINIDFSSITAAVNNPNFKIKIDFLNGSTTTTGNNRIDNIVIEGNQL